MMSRILAFLLLAGPLLAAEGESLLKNGSFDQGTVENTSPAAPSSWALGYIEGPASEPWIVVAPTGESESCAQITAGPDGPGKCFLYQDVAIEPHLAGPYVLRWKAKGTGAGEAGVYPREGSEGFQPRYEKFNAASDYQTYEVFVEITPEIKFLRIMVQALSEEPVVFTGFEFVPEAR